MVRRIQGWKRKVSASSGILSNVSAHDGKGTFFDPRLDDAAKFPIAAKADEGHVHNSEDLVTGKLSALQFYQLAIAAPASAWQF
jgi:hypothetical protein